MVETFTIIQRRIDTRQNFQNIVASGMTWDRVVSYLTAVYEMKSSHGLHAWDEDKQPITVPWFSRMVYDILPD